MFKKVQEYADALNQMAKEMDFTMKTYNTKTYKDVSHKAIEGLGDFLEKNADCLNEEFVAAFTVCCNFLILHQINKKFNGNFGWDILGKKCNIDKDSMQLKYLRYIWDGIRTQEIEYFLEAMRLYNFVVPTLYVYMKTIEKICLSTEDDIANNADEIVAMYDQMEEYRRKIERIDGSLIEPERPALKDMYSTLKRNALLPKIRIANPWDEQVALMVQSHDEFVQFLIENRKYPKKYSEEDFRRRCNEWNQLFMIQIDVVKNAGNSRQYDNENQSNSKRFGAAQPLVEHAKREKFLMLHLEIPEKDYSKIALAKQLKLNKDKDDLIRKNDKMVEDYSHSVENIMKPALIAQIANCLREDEKNRDLYNKIMYTYFNEVITRNECRLLKMVHSVSVSKGAIRESISKSKRIKAENGISMKKIVYKALNQISLQLAEDSQKARFMYILEKMAQAEIDSGMIDSKLWESSKEVDAVYKMYEEKLDFKVEISEDLKDIELNVCSRKLEAFIL